MAADGCRVTVLGPLDVSLDGRSVGPGPRAIKANTLLTVLALNANRVVDKDELTAALWNDPPPTAPNLVEKYVSMWRRELDSARLETIGHGYRLNLGVDECDLLACERDLRLGRAFAATGDLRAAARAWSQSLERWTSGLGDIAYAPVPRADGRRLAELYLATLEEWASVVLSLGEADDDLQTMLGTAQMHEPMRERLTELRMWALYQTDRQADALQCYDRLRRSLDTELGQQPGAAVRAMQVRVLRQDATLLGPRVAHLATVANLPRRHRHFVGREVELARIGHQLDLPNDGRTPTALALWGLVGGGKSALALEYAHRRIDLFDCIWWIDAGTQASLAGGLEALGARLGCELPTDREQGLDAVWVALERRGRWLIVFDNASTTADLGRFWPQAVNGTVLVSSLNPDWRGLAETMPVDVLTSAESVAMLATHHPHAGAPDLESAPALAAALGHLPLALGQAAAYMDQTGMSVTQYLQMFLRRRGQLLQRGMPDDHAGTVDTAWRLASAELAATQPAAVQLLAYGSFLAPEHIPLELLRSMSALLPAELQAAVADEVGLEDAIHYGRRYSLVARHGDELAMHFLVQEVVSASLTTAEHHQWQRSLCLGLAEFAPRSVHPRQDWPRWEILGPHIAALAAHCVATRIAEADFILLLRRTSEYYLTRGTFAQAATLLQAALDLAETLSDHQDAVLVGQILTELGTALEQSGRYRESLAAQERAVAVLQRLCIPEDPWVARSLSGLSSVLTCHLGVTRWRPDELDEASDRLIHALEVLRAALDPQDPVIARTMAALGQVEQDRGDLEQGLRHLQVAVDILENTYGRDHPETARTYSKLAYVLCLLGEFDRSVELQGRAIASLQATYGVHDVEVGWPMSNLAMAHLAAGRPEVALDLQGRAHLIFAARDPGGAAAQITAWRMAKVQLSAGRPAAAALILQPALDKLHLVMDASQRDLIEMTADLAEARSAAHEDTGLVRTPSSRL